MVDPVSILGAFAATTQILTYSLRTAAGLSNLRRNIRSAASTIENLLNEVECFLNIAENVRSERQIPARNVRLDKLIDDSIRTARSLEHLLRGLNVAQNKGKYSQAWSSVKYLQKCKEIEKLLSTVERGKSTLLLQQLTRPNSINSQRLHAPPAELASEGPWMLSLPQNPDFVDQDCVIGSSQNNYRSSSIMGSVAIIERELGNLEKAAGCVSTMIERQNHFPSDVDTDDVISQGNIGLSLQRRGHYEAAIEWHWKAVALSERHFGHEHALTLKQVENYALSLFKQGRLGDARDCFEQMLTLRKERFGLYHVGTLDTLDHLAVVLQAQGLWDLAGNYHQQAWEGRVAILGATHPDTFHSKANLAEIYRRKGNLSMAKHLIEEVLKFFQTVYGEDHPTTLIALGNLGILFQCQEDYIEAERITKEVIDRRRYKLGRYHPDVLMSMYDLSVLFQYQDKHQDALDLGREVLEARRRIMAEDHLDRKASEDHVPKLQENLEYSLEKAQGGVARSSEEK